MKLSKNPEVIIILGPPGSGKGTQAELLAEKTDLYHFETSEVLEESFNQKGGGKFIEVGGKKYYFSDEKKNWKSGLLCSPPFVIVLVKKKIKELFKSGKSLIFSASPRTLYEGKELIPLFKKLYGASNIKILLFKQNPEVSIWRNSRRRICELLRHPILYTKETVNLKICPLDGSKLIKRGGLDNPKTIKIRLKEYQERTLPLIGYLKKKGFKIKEINAEQPVADIFKDVLKALQ